ncbi:MAG: 5'-methylthioadenosine/adenosylhomocysteine nucleosidase [Sinobacteraceae bacterium]|nr:5'-methylthioadenosine/adenosylhomocysteine nucleosidase [Nevskiaceae bacterium]
MLAIVSAMPEEIAGVLEALQRAQLRTYGGRDFHVGTFQGREAVAVFSRLGKVAAAATVTQLISAFPVSELIFGGVAGALQPGLHIGDIIVASALIQHDMDASPLFPRYEVPLLGKARFVPPTALRVRLLHAARQFAAQELRATVASEQLEFFGIRTPQIHEGLIASGDKFFANEAEINGLRQRLPAAACVEMEGAAVAQVCDEYEVPYAVLRTISDAGDESAVHDFPRFAREISHHYLRGIMARYLGHP